MTAKTTADIIVIGAGAAGCTVAGRLAQAGRKVIVLEAGGDDWNPIYRVPVMTGLLARSAFATWPYPADPDPRLGERALSIPQGRVVGGSSSINGMLWLRGRPRDYDGWAENGLPNWDWAHVAPVLDAIERLEEGAPGRGTNGAIPIMRPPIDDNPFYRAYFAAAEQAGFQRTADLNAPPFEGVAPFDANIAGGARWSAARAYLGPARKGDNLRVVTRAQATRVIVEKGVARAVAALVKGRETIFRADEIIVCAGAIATPKLLMLSGIGPADTLKAFGLPVLADLPGVGQNFHDHVGVVCAHAASGPLAFEILMRLDKGAVGFLRAALFGTGLAASAPFAAGSFLRSTPDAPETDFKHTVVPMPGPPKIRLPLLSPPQAYGFAISVMPLRPESRGSVTLRSADPLAAPRLQPKYLSAQNDLDITRRGVRITRDIIAQPAFDGLRGAELKPGGDVQTDAELDAWIMRNGGTCYHPVGTCKMGADSDPLAVLDGSLRVRGIAGLRVADASAMPHITSANTHAPSIMIGYRCADFML